MPEIRFIWNRNKIASLDHSRASGRLNVARSTADLRRRASPTDAQRIWSGAGTGDGG